jgi:hypothetical protein
LASAKTELRSDFLPHNSQLHSSPADCDIKVAKLYIYVYILKVKLIKVGKLQTKIRFFRETENY